MRAPLAPNHSGSGGEGAKQQRGQQQQSWDLSAYTVSWYT